MTDETRELTPEMLIRAVMDNQDMIEAINANPLKVMLSPDGSEAELSIAEVVPPIVVATVHALAEFGILNWTQPDQSQVG